MSSNVNVPTPTFHSNSSYEIFKKEVSVWQKITSVPAKKQGLHVLLCLPGKDKDPSGIKEKLLEECEIETFNQENGLQLLITAMDKYLAKDCIQDAWEKFQEFEECIKTETETWFQFINRFDTTHDRVKAKGMTLPEPILAFKLLRAANLNTDERLIIMTGLDLEKQGEMYKDAKAALKKFKGGANSISKTEVKEEYDTFFAKPDYQRRPPYGSRGRYGTRGRGRYEPRKGSNPTDRYGKTMRCIKCDSLLHLIKDCPHKEERVNMASNEQDQKDSASDNVPVVMFTNNKEELVLLTNEAAECGVLDSGCASTVCGRRWLETYIDQLDTDRQAKVVRTEGHKSFQFGGEYKLQSQGIYKLPAEILGKPVVIETDVVESNIPLLFSNKALGVMKAKIDYSNDRATIFGRQTTLDRTSAGHHCIKITPEEVHVAAPVQMSKEVVVKLHKQYGHPGKQNFIKHLKTADMWDDRLNSIIDEIYKGCHICQQFATVKPGPVVALPMASKFNEVVAIDLKAWKDGWILYMIDMFSRFTVSTFIRRKRPEEVIEAIIKEWIGVFGVMEKLLSDNGGEFNAEEFRYIESLLNIDHKTTGAESPFQNGLCERNHAVTDMILSKLQAQYPTTPLPVLIKWSTMAKNSLQMWAGFSSHQLVFGVNPNLPNVLDSKTPGLEDGSYSKAYSRHVAALHTAREEFIKSEASEKIKRALRHNIRVSNEVFKVGQKVFYRKLGLDQWQGPATVIGQDGKVVIIKHASYILRSSPSRLQKAETYEETGEKKETLYDNDISQDSQDSPTGNEMDTGADEANEEETTTPTTQNTANEALRRSLRVFNKENNAEVYNTVEHNSKECLEAKKEELSRLKQFNVYDEVPNTGQSCISTRWVITKKGDNVKARLTARGFEEDIASAVDSPTIGKNCVRMLLAIAASKHWNIGSTDIKSAFLQGQLLEREVFLLPPKESNTGNGFVWKLRRCLYGLNDAARQFYVTLAEELEKLGAVKSKLDPSLFSFYSDKGLRGILVSHIDDFLHAGDSDFEQTVIKKLCDRFSAGSRETREFKYTGYHLKQNSDHSIYMDQNHYLKNVTTDNVTTSRLAQKAEKLSDGEISLYRKNLGILGWVVQGTRPELSFSLLESSTNTKHATVGDLQQLIKIVRNAKDTETKILFPDLGDPRSWRIVVFTDASYANLNEGTGSCGGYVVFLVGVDNKVCPLSWRSNKIRRVCRSTASAEGMSLSQGLEEAIYNRNLLCDTLKLPKKAILVQGITDHEGLQGNICNALKPKVDDLRLRQEIAIMREYLQFGEVDQVKLCSTQQQLADCLTKKGANRQKLVMVLEEGILPQGF